MMTILGMLVNKLMTRSHSQVIDFGPEFSWSACCCYIEIGPKIDHLDVGP